jgi:hypothetical protein
LIEGSDGIWTGIPARRTMPAQEFLDDHRFPIVGRANQEKVRHALLARPVEQGLQACQCRDGAWIADPPIGPNVHHPFAVRERRGRAQRGV